jgi:hypothetical protein
MSFETLLFLALFILVPLLERLLQAARQRRVDTPDGSVNRPRQTLPPTGNSKVSSPPVVSAGVLSTSQLPPLAARPAEAAPGPAGATPRGRSRARQWSPMADLRDPLTLHRAIVLMTILGPCRANTPYESRSQRVASRGQA